MNVGILSKYNYQFNGHMGILHFAYSKMINRHIKRLIGDYDVLLLSLRSQITGRGGDGWPRRRVQIKENTESCIVYR